MHYLKNMFQAHIRKMDMENGYKNIMIQNILVIIDEMNDIIDNKKGAKIDS